MTPLSPLRYPGGKAKLARTIARLLAANDVVDGLYVEPFAGGAGVAVELLLHQHVSSIWINDLDLSVYAFWHCVLHRHQELCEWVNTVELTISEWKRQREIQTNWPGADLFSLGCSTLFLNRTNRSGIISGGVIGGLAQSGPWKIDARFNRQALTSRIRSIARYRDYITLTNVDAIQLIASLEELPQESTFIYFDPPYFEKGGDLYLNSFTYADHERLANAIQRSNLLNWIVTYDCVERVKALYAASDKYEYGINYSAASAVRGRELMIFSPHVRSEPEFEGPRGECASDTRRINAASSFSSATTTHP